MMFSGITQGLCEVTKLLKKPHLLSYTVNLSNQLAANLQLGASVAINGVCQTLIDLDGTKASFQAIRETLEKTTLSELTLGAKVSIERSLRLGDEIGGHEVSGHVYGTATVHQRIEEQESLTLVIHCTPAWMKYILPKGFIAVDGSSLTVGQTIPEEGLFYVHLIPETLRRTNFHMKKPKDKVNIEFDHKTKTIVDTVERFLALKETAS